jgi:hypothetical protein
MPAKFHAEFLVVAFFVLWIDLALDAVETEGVVRRLADQTGLLCDSTTYPAEQIRAQEH